MENYSLEDLRANAFSTYDGTRFSHVPQSEHQKTIILLSKISDQNKYIIALLEEAKKERENK